MATVVILWLALIFIGVRGDYTCVCNYNVELNSFSAKSETSSKVGTLYEFDCKEVISGMAPDPAWVAIAFEHKVAYIKKGANVQEQQCPGDPPSSDVVLPTMMTTTGFPVPTRLTTTPTITSTLGGPIPGDTSPTPTILQPKTPPPTTMPPPTTPPPTTMPPPTTPTTTLPPTTETSLLPTTPAPTTPAPTTQSSTTPSAQSSSESTTTAISQTSPSSHTVNKGNTSLCPASVQQAASRDHGILMQYDKSCYEIVSHHVTWTSAEASCKQRGGHLMHINNAEEQTYFTQYLLKYYSSEVWIGLSDKGHEEKFTWTSGDPTSYTHWDPHRKNGIIHGSEDCVVLQPRDSGYWDDRMCSGIFASKHGYVCQFHTLSGPAIIG